MTAVALTKHLSYHIIAPKVPSKVSTKRVRAFKRHDPNNSNDNVFKLACRSSSYFCFLYCSISLFFAQRTNAKLTLHFLHLWMPLSRSFNLVSVSWSNARLWCHGDTTCNEKVHRKIHQHQAIWSDLCYAGFRPKNSGLCRGRKGSITVVGNDKSKANGAGGIQCAATAEQ